MALLPIVLSNVAKAFAIAQEFTAQVTFQLQIVYVLDPANDTATETPSFTKTVAAIIWKNVPKRGNDTGNIFDEFVAVQCWRDGTPAPTVLDKMLDPDGTVRQIMSVSNDPAGALWVVQLRGPTRQP